MQRHHDQDGAALVMIIGIVAALAILAATLVAVTVNAQTGTSHDRMRAKAVDVAEGSVDATLAKMSDTWPATSTQAMDTTATAALEDTVRGLFPTGGLDGNPDPPAGQAFVKIYVYDNSDTNGDGIDRDDAHYDSDADGVMNVEVQANVGGQRAGIVTQVTASKTTLDVAKTAIYGHGNLTLDGVNQIKSDVGATGSDTTGVNAISTGTFEPDTGSSNALLYGCAPGVTPVQNSPLTLYDMIPEITLDALQQKCFATKAYPYRYYTSAPTSADASYLAGVVVVDPGATGTATVDLKDNQTTPTAPGILIVTRGAVTFTGRGQSYYGMIIVRDPGTNTLAFTLGGGSYVYGMVFVNGAATLNGGGAGGPGLSATDPNLVYDSAVAGLLKSNTIVLKVRVVPNTWRQVMPQ